MRIRHLLVFGRTFLGLAVVFWNANSACASDPVEVNTCGQLLERSGYLAADLDCSSSATDPAVTLGLGGTLDLRGFTLTGRAASANGPAVQCGGRCTILGPGTIVGSPVDVAHVVSNETYEGAKIAVDGATISGGGVGVVGRRVKLRNAVVTNNRWEGVTANFASVANSEVSGNGYAPDDPAPHLGCYWAGVCGYRRAVVVNSVVTGNGTMGVQGARVEISGSSVTDNHANPACATKLCVDVSARFRPQVEGSSSCETSLDERSSAPRQPLTETRVSWGVCSLD